MSHEILDLYELYFPPPPFLYHLLRWRKSIHAAPVTICFQQKISLSSQLWDLVPSGTRVQIRICGSTFAYWDWLLRREQEWIAVVKIHICTYFTVMWWLMLDLHIHSLLEEGKWHSWPFPSLPPYFFIISLFWLIFTLFAFNFITYRVWCKCHENVSLRGIKGKQ